MKNRISSTAPSRPYAFVVTAAIGACSVVTLPFTKIQASIIPSTAPSTTRPIEKVEEDPVDKLHADVLAQLEALHGTNSEIVKTPYGLVWVATAIGFADNVDSKGRAVPRSLQRIRAVRAAVVNAKAELAGAEQFNKKFATNALVQIEVCNGVEKKTSFSQEVVVLARTMLGSVEIWKSEVHLDSAPDKEGRLIARVWIYSKPSTSGDTIAAGKGWKAFPTRQLATKSLAALAAQGLCDEGVVTVLVGTPGNFVPVTFAIAACIGEKARVGAQVKLAGLLRANWSSEVSGSSSKQLSVIDPLSTESAAIISADFKKTNTVSSAGSVRISQCECETTADGVVFCASWLLGVDE